MHAKAGEDVARIVRGLVARYGISSRFGPRYLYQYGHHFHAGIDIPTPLGTPIRFPFPVRVEPVGGYGYAAKIPDGEWLFIFAHLLPNQPDSYTVLTGNTGRVTGPHLHFEVRRSGRPIDPEEWLNSYFGGAEAALLSAFLFSLVVFYLAQRLLRVRET